MNGLPTRVAASSGVSEAVGRPRPRAMVSAMLLRVMPFLGHSGQDAARGCLLHSEAEQDRRVKPMDGGPPVGAVADVRRYARPACGGDEQGNEAVVLGAVDRGGEADHTRAYSSVGAVQARALTGDAERREPGCVGFVLLGALPAAHSPRVAEVTTSGLPECSNGRPSVSNAGRLRPIMSSRSEKSPP